MPYRSRRHRILLPFAVGATSASAAFALGHVGGAAATPAQSDSPTRAKNVILFIGDGMGAAARTAGQYRYKGLYGQLEMDDMPYAGSIKTAPRDPEAIITDSAAAGTALATGVRTFNGAIAVDVNRKPVRTIGERAKKAGKALGLVTTAQVTDATPAAFGAHVSDRSQQDEIARQYLENTKVDVILGGGEDRWYPAGTPGKYADNPAKDPTEKSSSTKGNLVRRAEQLGYSYAWNGATLDKASGSKVLGLFSNEEMFEQRTEAKGGAQYEPVVPLTQMTAKALEVLNRDRDGFLLLVEEEAIDELAHANHGALTLKGVAELDRAVALAKRYAAAHPDTLVITGADHETGGLAVESVDAKDESGSGDSVEDGPFPIAGSSRKFVIDWTTTGHTGVNVPFTGKGPGAHRLTGTIDNTDIYHVMARAAFGGDGR